MKDSPEKIFKQLITLEISLQETASRLGAYAGTHPGADRFLEEYEQFLSSKRKRSENGTGEAQLDGDLWSSLLH